MTPADYDFLRSLLKQRSGLVLGEGKLYLLESRLVPLARERGLKGLNELVACLRNGAAKDLLDDVTDAMTTNESFFFRDTKPFEIFRNQTLPQLLRARAGRRHIRIWSAACSTGQEPYSLAMILREEPVKTAGYRFDIVASDLARDVLDKAGTGIYSQFEVQRGLPIQYLMKYFAKVGEMWQIDPSIRAMVNYRQINLLEDLGAIGPVDVIFCRNVLIYFDQPTKRQILEKMSQLLPPDGYLFLGGAETVLGITNRLRPIEGLRGVYANAA